MPIPVGHFRCRVILAASRKGRGCFRSLDEMPVGLRQELESATRSPESATILIADAEGERFLQKLRVPGTTPPPPAPSVPPRASGLSTGVLVHLAAGAVAALLLWLAGSLR